MSAPFITWKEFYSVGCQELDDQHSTILAIFNDVYMTLQSGEEQQATKRLLDRLVQYTMDHFQREEELMEECGYPDLAQHKILHERLTEETIDFRRHFRTVTREKLLAFLKVWWVNHICQADKQYSPYMRAVPTG